MRWYIVCIITLSVISEITDKSLRNILLRGMRLRTHNIPHFNNGFFQRPVCKMNYISYSSISKNLL